MIGIFDSISYLWIIIIISLIITIISTLAYKYTTDQRKLKRVKEDIKKLREKQKKHVDNQKKFMAIQKEMMSKNSILMKESFKPMIFTLLPLLLVFGWMAANLAFQPIMPGDVFRVTIDLEQPEAVELQLPQGFEVIGHENESWSLRSNTEGKFQLVFVGETFTETKEVLITTSKDYVNPVQTYDSNLRSVTIHHKEVKPLGDVSLFGWRPGWLGTYILLSIILSILLRKLLRVN